MKPFNSFTFETLCMVSAANTENIDLTIHALHYCRLNFEHLLILLGNIVISIKIVIIMKSPLE